MSYVIEQSLCSGCHRCRMECPVDAIKFKNAKYWIDPEKCIACGSCAAVCHNGCISNPDRPEPEAKPHDPIKLECDVCVIGAGAAGMVAAAKAQDMGASVIVLEKNHEIGGSAWYATGFAVHYSKWHREAGMQDNRAQTYQQFLQKTAGHDVDPELLKRLFDANADWIDWMIDQHHFSDLYELNSQGFGPMCMKKKVAPPWNDRRIDNMIGPGGGGWLIPTSLFKDFTEKGGQVLCSTPAKKLLTNGSGEIVGVLAEDKGGMVEVSCKSVVMSSGAFTRNREIMDKMQPLFYDDEGKQPVHIFTCSTCTGDGITMCEELGADIDYVNRRVNLFGPMRHPYPGVTLNIGDGPMFKTNGDRYEMKGGMTEVSDLAYDPKRYVWKIVDDKNAKAAIEDKIAQGRDDNGVDLSHFLKNWREVLQQEAEDNAVIIADSIPELASKLDFDPVKFSMDIAQYNEYLMAEQRRPMMPPISGPNPDNLTSPGMSEIPAGMPAMPAGIPAMPAGMPEMPTGMPEMPTGMPEMPAGIPEMFSGMELQGGADGLMEMLAKMMGPPAQPLTTGPFYAIKLSLFHENSMGGMTIDKNASVLKNGEPIPGLYAAGDTTRGVMVPGDIGVQYIEGVFTALTYAFNSGYISGVEAAKHALYRRGEA